MSAPEPGDQPTYSLPPAAERRGPRGALLGAAMIVTLLLIGVIGYVVIGRGGDDATTVEGTADPGSAQSAGQTASGEVAPGEPAPGEPAPGGSAPGEPAPGESAPGEPAPGGAATGQPPSGRPGSSTPGAGQSSGQANPSGKTIDAYQVKDGDCLSDPGVSSTVTSLVRLPCSQPHDAEVFAVYQLPEPKGAPYPGDTELQNLSDDGCAERLSGFLGIENEESTLDYRLLAPTQKTWQDGDREVVCQVFDPNGPTTGSQRGSRR